MSNELTGHARAMRRGLTEPEKRLWRHLSNFQLGGFKFRRQAVIGRWIVEFLCPAKALIGEVDGDPHDPKQDARRNAALRAAGYRTLRFTNADVIGNMDGVLTAIIEAARSTADRSPHPNPSTEGDGLDPSSTLSPSPSGEGIGVGPSLS